MAGSGFSGAVRGNATVKVDDSDYYVLVVANTAATGSADVLYQYATYSVNSTGAHRAGELNPRMRIEWGREVPKGAHGMREGGPRVRTA